MAAVQPLSSRESLSSDVILVCLTRSTCTMVRFRSINFTLSKYGKLYRSVVAMRM